MNKLKSRKFLLTLLAHIGSGYLMSTGHTQEAAILSGIAQGSYNIGQGMADSASNRATEIAVSAATEAFANAKK